MARALSPPPRPSQPLLYPRTRTHRARPSPSSLSHPPLLVVQTPRTRTVPPPHPNLTLPPHHPSPIHDTPARPTAPPPLPGAGRALRHARRRASRAVGSAVGALRSGGPGGTLGPPRHAPDRPCPGPSTLSPTPPFIRYRWPACRTPCPRPTSRRTNRLFFIDARPHGRSGSRLPLDPGGH